MIFKVMRTSFWNDSKEKPCEETFRIEKDEDEYPWANWAVEINSLQELINFQKKVKNEIILGTTFKKKEPYIEIYDSYRE